MSDGWADEIKAKQEERGVSSARLARIMGVTQATVCRWRKDEIKPKGENATRMRRWLDGEVLMETWPPPRQMGRPAGTLSTKRAETPLGRLADKLVDRYGGVQLAAAAVGVSHGTLCQMRQGDSGARWATVEKIVKAAGGRIVIEV